MTPAEVDAVAEQFAAACDHLTTPEGARGSCYAASVAFLYDLHTNGLIESPYVPEVEVLRVWDFDPIPHYVARVGERTFDFTARQFDPDAAFPVVATVADYKTLRSERRTSMRGW